MIKKTVRSNDVETRFIKYSKSIILPIISDLFNLCVNKGVFPNCLKITEIIPIYKKGNLLGIKLGKFMHQLENNKLPHDFLNFF